MRVLGIDPGSAATGFGVVERQGGDLVHVAHGVIRVRSGDLAARLDQLYAALRAVLEQHQPDTAAVEQVFVASSPRSALVLGQARGAVLAALGASGLPVSEYSASQVKQCVAGDGRASKAQVQRMVRRVLVLERSPATDAADALAVALRHLHGSRLELAGVAAPRQRPRARRDALRTRLLR